MEKVVGETDVKKGLCVGFVHYHSHSLSLTPQLHCLRADRKWFSHLEAETLPKVTCMVYFEVSMTCSEIYTLCFSQ